MLERGGDSSLSRKNGTNGRGFWWMKRNQNHKLERSSASANAQPFDHGSGPGPPRQYRGSDQKEICGKRCRFFPQNGFEAHTLGVETNQPPSAFNAPPFLVRRARGANSDFFFDVRTLGAGERQATSADRFGAHSKLKWPFYPSTFHKGESTKSTQHLSF